MGDLVTSTGREIKVCARGTMQKVARLSKKLLFIFLYVVSYEIPHCEICRSYLDVTPPPLMGIGERTRA